MAEPQDLLSSARRHLASWEHDAATRELHEALQLARRLGDLESASECLVELAGLGATTGDAQERDQALLMALEAADGFRTLGLRAREGMALYWAGMLSDHSAARAESLLSRALVLLDEERATYGEVAFCCRLMLGDLALNGGGRLDTAELHYLEAWELLPSTRSRLALPRLAQSLARVALKRGDAARAADYLEKALDALGPVLMVGARVQEAECRVLLGEARESAGDLAGARGAYELALRAFTERSVRERVSDLESRLHALSAAGA